MTINVCFIHVVKHWIGKREYEAISGLFSSIDKFPSICIVYIVTVAGLTSESLIFRTTTLIFYIQECRYFWIGALVINMFPSRLSVSFLKYLSGFPYILFRELKVYCSSSQREWSSATMNNSTTMYTIKYVGFCRFTLGFH